MLRKLLLSLSIISLFHVQLSFNVMTLSIESAQAYAQSESSNESNPLTKNKTAQMESGLSGEALNILTMMLMGYVLSRLVVMCKPVPADVMVAAGSGAVYLAGEIMSQKDFKKMKNKRIDYVVTDDGSGTEDQVKALMAQRGAYEDVKKTAKTKKMLQMAAAAGIGAAGIMAIFTDVNELKDEALCSVCSMAVAARASTREVPIVSVPGLAKSIKESTAGVAECTAANTASTVQAFTPNVAACISKKSSVFANHMQCGTFSGFGSIDHGSEVQKLFAGLDNIDEGFIESVLQEFGKGNSRELLLSNLNSIDDVELMASLNPYVATSRMVQEDRNVLNSLIIEEESNRFFKGELSSMSVEDYDKMKNRVLEAHDFVGEEKTNNFLILAAQEGINLFSPSVMANPLGLVGTVATVAAAMLVPINAKIDLYLVDPAKRKYIFAVMAGMALLAANSTQKVMDKAQKNIDEIDKIIERLNQWKANNENPNKGVEGGTHKLLAAGGFKSFGKHSPVALTDANTPIDCVIPGKTPGTCGSLTSAIERSSSIGSFPSSLGSIASDVGGVADSIQGNTSLSSGDLAAIEALGNKNAAIKANLDGQIKKLDENREDGKKASDITKGLAAQMNNAVLKTLKKQGMSPSGFLGSAGVQAPASSSDKDSKKEVAAEYKPVKKKAAVAAIAKPKNPKFDFKFDDGGESFSDEMAANQKAVDELDASKESKDDIVKNRDVSIFKVMSTRYKKSYGKLFDEEK